MTRVDHTQPKPDGAGLLDALSLGDQVVKAAHDWFAWGSSLPVQSPGYRLDELSRSLATRAAAKRSAF